MAEAPTIRVPTACLDGYGLPDGLRYPDLRRVQLLVAHGCGPAPEFDRLPRRTVM